MRNCMRVGEESALTHKRIDVGSATRPDYLSIAMILFNSDNNMVKVRQCCLHMRIGHIRSRFNQIDNHYHTQHTYHEQAKGGVALDRTCCEELEHIKTPQ